MTGCRLQVDAVRLGYDERTVVDGLDLDVADDEITVIIGPNGCGKSTLLRGMGRLLRPRGGAVLLDGRRIDRLPTKEVAKHVGVLPQTPSAPEGLTVGDLVSRGRQPHQRWYRQWSADDEDAVTHALAVTGMDAYADRVVDELSGGQRQRAWISMTLAQDTSLLLLDEPITYLDLAHQVEVLDLAHRLHTERGTTVVMVLHDLNLAARYAHTLVAMNEGRIVAQGPPGEVLTEQLLSDVFGLDAKVLPDPVAGTPLVVPISAHLRDHA
ncbi:ABC transporter ATP-binding protein [Prauserella rugosa]|uniref:Iron complex transport system ATP-binding protein n=1 Tax=Prauserella rugosa TaxID=43354 RepID=A0A660CGI0_9PSEU|nr:ABC transporter ATP-binding protein [Prauserella rugosa]KMS80127.1 cobalamin ABC transporter ATPase [Streptomyces regensis]TWH22658.1 iron complex transport system ATP-binding protein [Prauserella rugosa]